MDKIAVLIPCYNESQTIKKVVEDWKKELPEATIYVYDNNSSDNTAAIAREAGAVVRYEYQQGKGNVIRRMFREIDAECYIMIDGDDTYPAEFGREMVTKVLERNVDMVVGDRLSSTYFEENKRRFHNSGNKLVRKLINFIFKNDISDIMTGMRGFSYEFVKSFPVSSKEFEIETEMTIFALNHNFLIKELPIEYKDRMEGSESKLNTFSDGYKVISLLFGLFRDVKPLFFFSLITLVLLIIASMYFFPVLIGFFRTGFVEKVPTLITVGVVVIVAVIIFFTGVVLHVIRKQHDENFEHYLTMITQNKKD